MTKIFAYCPKCGITMESKSLIIAPFGMNIECEKGHNTMIKYEKK
jgi:hypothetical protein